MFTISILLTVMLPSWLIQLVSCLFGPSRGHRSDWQCFGPVPTAPCMQRDNSAAMTAPALRSWRQTRSGAVLRTERTTGARLPTRGLLVSLDSPTGSMTSSASTTAACGRTTATTTSNTGRPATAGVTSHPAQVSESLVTEQFMVI